MITWNKMKIRLRHRSSTVELSKKIQSESSTLGQRGKIILMTLLTVMGVEFLSAQDLINEGRINNTGTFRVKNQVVFGSQDTIGGIFDYFGASQVVPAKNYQNLLLSGSGIKQTSGGNFAVFGDITIAPAVSLEVESGAILRMDGTLFEQGYLLGSILKNNVDLSGGTTTSDFGNIGTTISWTGIPPGLTSVTRTSGVALVGDSSQSIQRYYDILPTTNSGLDATLVLRYSNTELNGHDPAKLLLWKSVDGGQTWRLQRGIVDTATHTVTKTNVSSFGRYTLADSLHPLGPLTPEAGILASLAGNGQSESIFTTLQPFVVAVTDSDGQAVKDAPITFNIISTPVGAVGQFMSQTVVNTDSNGIASSVLHLGSKIGVYNVSVSASGVDSITFTATAIVGAPHTLADISGGNQSGVISTMLAQPFIVSVVDSGGNTVSGVPVHFAIVDTPNNSFGQQITVADATTDSLGQASTLLTLGTKVGQYVVHASSSGLNGSPVAFTATATVGLPHWMTLTSGNNQTGIINTTLASAFVVNIADSGGNPVAGAAVYFAIADSPNGASGQLLSVNDIVTDSLGQASSILTLGNKIGQYVVTATSAGLNGSPITFTANATVGIARNLAVLSGNNQTGTVGAVLAQPFVTAITDSGGNAVPGINVQFAIVDTPGGATGQQLTVINAISDSLGQASTLLTFGIRPGFYRITATSAGLSGSPVTFAALANVGPAFTMAMSSGSGQSGLTNDFLPQPFVVLVTDTFGNPVAGRTIRYAVVSKPAGAVNDSLTSQLAVSDSSGLAETYLRLGDKAGVYTVTASDSNLQGSPVSFTASAISRAAARLIEVSGNNQEDTVNTSVQNPFTVRVTDISGNPVAGTMVHFRITGFPDSSTGQRLSVDSTISDSTGFASTFMTLGKKAGIYLVSASSVGLTSSPIEFRTMAVPARPAIIAQVSGDNQQATILTQLAQPFNVTVTDSFGNVVPNTDVLFNILTTPAGAIGYALSQDTVATDSIGHARTFMTNGSKVGDYITTASIVGVTGTPITFISRATPGVAAILALTSGNNQMQDIASELSQPFVVTVTDIGGNVVQGTQVHFAIATTPNGSRGQSLSDTMSVSDSLGNAKTFLTLGHKRGAYRVAASSQGLANSPITLEAIATAFLADANGDGRANIADITTLIDKILGEIQLSDANLTRADVDTNDMIDNRDRAIILDGILDGKWDTLSAVSDNELQTADDTYEAEVEWTKNGLRFNLKNDAPVKGVQIALRFRSVTTIDRPEVVFKRSKHMSVPMQPSANVLRIVLYNDDNTPIDTGEGSLFRLATKNVALNDFDIEYVIVSTEANEGLYIPFNKVDGSGKYPDSYALLQNFPNPFNNQTKLRFQVPDVPGRFAPVLLQIFSIDGERIRTLVKGDFEAGTYDFSWDGTNDNGQVVSSGMYLYRLWTRDLMLVKKMMFIK
jgi:hypothetical protein